MDNRSEIPTRWIGPLDLSDNVVYNFRVRFTFVHTAEFVGDWKALRLNDGDLRVLENAIAGNPGIGAVMSGTGGLRKMRFAPPSMHRGKSGSTRVGYVAFDDLGTVYLLFLFPKNAKENLTAAEREHFRRFIAALWRYTKDLRDKR